MLKEGDLFRHQCKDQMLVSIRDIFSGNTGGAPTSVPPGERVYAIGDIHGRADLFGEMIQAIERDNAIRGSAFTTVVLLGDLIDRGMRSATVIEMTRVWQKVRTLRIIAGNHEQVFLEGLSDLDAFAHFIEFGGRETILSYGVDEATLEAASLVEAQKLMVAAVPPEDVAFVSDFEDYVEIGDYLFVHAGIYPGRRLEAQQPRHLRWIREPFLSYRGSHDRFVVHGHTVTTTPDLRHNRLGLDVGAFSSGRLAAVGLEDNSRWLIGVEETRGAIRSSTRVLGRHGEPEN